MVRALHLEGLGRGFDPRNPLLYDQLLLLCPREIFQAFWCAAERLQRTCRYPHLSVLDFTVLCPVPQGFNAVGLFVLGVVGVCAALLGSLVVQIPGLNMSNPPLLQS